MKKWVFEHKGRDELNTWWENPTVESKWNSRFKLFIRGPGMWEFNSSSWGVRVGLSRISGHNGWNAVPGVGPGLYIIGLSRATKSRKNGRANSGESYGPRMSWIMCCAMPEHGAWDKRPSKKVRTQGCTGLAQGSRGCWKGESTKGITSSKASVPLSGSAWFKCTVSSWAYESSEKSV